MIWDTLAFDPDDMRYSCSWCGLFAEVLSGGIKLSISRGYVEGAFSNARKG